MGVSEDATFRFGNRDGSASKTPSSGSDCQRSMIILEIMYLVVDYRIWVMRSTIKHAAELRPLKAAPPSRKEREKGRAPAFVCTGPVEA